MTNVEEIKHRVDAGTVELIIVRVRQMGIDGKERGTEYEYSTTNLVDFTIDTYQVYLEWKDGHSVNHNLRYVEQIWTS